MSVMGTDEAAGYIVELLDNQLSTLDLIRGEWAVAIKRSALSRSCSWTGDLSGLPYVSAPNVERWRRAGNGRNCGCSGRL